MNTATKERPIIFSAPMVRAIFEGRKTQTRRVVKGITDPESFEVLGDSGAGFLHSDKCQSFCDYACGGHEVECPYGKPGDRLWVKERFQLTTDARGKCVIVYAADDSAFFVLAEDGGEGDLCGVAEKADRSRCLPIERWRPSIHMPRWASRLTLEITGVRVERLQAISDADCLAEGINAERAVEDGVNRPYREEYARLWDSINGKGSWAANPWVWVIEFRRVEK